MTSQVIDPLLGPRHPETLRRRFPVRQVQGETPMNAPVALIDRYIAMWNTTNAEDRRDLIAGAWADSGAYVDPQLNGQGHDGIDAMVQAVQDRFPNHRFRRTSDVDAHNDRVRFGWELAAEGEAPLVRGVDFGVLSADGRLQSITGFFEPAA